VRKDNYTITIFWSDEDQAYIAVVEELEGCSAWGETYEDALSQVRQAMKLWLEAARGRGFPIPEPKAYPKVA
jgi:predicted RNase H-like HicB family nuclease